MKHSPYRFTILSVIIMVLTMIPCLFTLTSCGKSPWPMGAGQGNLGDMDLTNIPSDLREQLERCPELADFVAAYPEEHDKEHNPDVSGDYTPGEIPLFLQWDTRWGYEWYGDNMMALTGCGPTCLSMAAVGLTGNTSWNPLAVANFADENGYYCNGSGSYWTLISEGASALGLSAVELPLDENVIRNQLELGNPIICAVGPGDFTTQGHFLILTKSNDDGTVMLHDPNSRKNSQTSWNLQQVMHQMQNLWAISAR